jgi:hypothetical protein
MTHGYGTKILSRNAACQLRFWRGRNEAKMRCVLLACSGTLSFDRSRSIVIDGWRDSESAPHQGFCFAFPCGAFCREPGNWLFDSQSGRGSRVNRKNER